MHDDVPSVKCVSCDFMVTPYDDRKRATPMYAAELWEKICLEKEKGQSK